MALKRLSTLRRIVSIAVLACVSWIAAESPWNLGQASSAVSGVGAHYSALGEVVSSSSVCIAERFEEEREVEARHSPLVSFLPNRANQWRVLGESLLARCSPAYPPKLRLGRRFNLPPPAFLA